MLYEEEVKNFIDKNNMVILYFNGSECGACVAIERKVDKILEEYPKVKIKKINGTIYKEIASLYSVFSLPLIILYVEGKEVIRIGRTFNIGEFKNILNRYYSLLEL